MRIKIKQVAKHNGKPIGYTVRVSRWKFPREPIKMALNDYENFIRDTA